MGMGQFLEFLWRVVSRPVRFALKIRNAIVFPAPILAIFGAVGVWLSGNPMLATIVWPSYVGMSPLELRLSDVLIMAAVLFFVVGLIGYSIRDQYQIDG